MNEKRIEKLRTTLARKAESECSSLMSNTQEASAAKVSSRQIAADMMQVSEGYITMAQRVQREAPELFEEIFAGRITVTAAIRELDGVTDDPRTVRAKAARSTVSKLLKADDENPAFLDRLEALLAEFA